MLKDYPLLEEIAPDLLDMLRDGAEDEHTRRAEGGRIAAIGESVAARLSPLFDEARLTDAERAAVLRGAPVNLKRLLEQRPSLRRLAANPLLCAMICALHLEGRSNLLTESKRR